MLVFRQVLTCIFQVSRWWKAGALKSDEAISSDLNLKLFFYYCIVCVCMWYSYVIVSVEMLTTKIKNQSRDFELNQGVCKSGDKEPLLATLVVYLFGNQTIKTLILQIIFLIPY